MSIDAIQRDLSMKMQKDIGALFERNLQLFSVALDPAATGMLLVEACTMMAATTAATMAHVGAHYADQQHSDAAARDMFDFAFDQIIAEIQKAKTSTFDQALAEIRLRMAER